MTLLETPPGASSRDESLSFDEEIRLKQLENTIERGMRAGFEMGEALAEIRDEGLYRRFRDFEQYIRERWGMAPRHAYRLIEFSEVVRNLTHGSEDLPMLPKCERHARPLSCLNDPDQQREAWACAVETAPGGKITAKHVAEVVRQYRGEPDPSSDPIAWTIHQAIDRLGRSVYEISQRWPPDQFAVLAKQLHDLADELQASGQLRP